MQFRRSMMSSVMLLLLAGVVASTVAHAEVVKPAPMAMQKALQSKARLAKLRTNGAGDPDTVFIGHVTGATGLPGAAGGAGPFHIGRGGYLPSDPQNQGGAANNGYWNWDDLNAGEADAYQGWWILVQPQQSASSAVRNDWWRSSFCYDFGNAGNLAGKPGKATYGVTGYWHRDGGSTVTSGSIPAPGFTPLGGSASAWCGLRAHGDNSYTDPITGGVYNSSIVQYYGDNHFLQTGPFNEVTDVDPGPGIDLQGGTDNNFPGYGDQWDQMLYRDVTVADLSGLSLSYKYDVNLVPGHSTAALTRVGWFMMDPLLDIPGAVSSDPLVADGNFISSSAFNSALPDLAPEDSFMVYVGVPVNDAAVTYTDGNTAPVGDPLRRWFSEVLAIDGWTPGGAGVGDQWPATLIQLVSLSGTASGTASISLTNAQIQPILDAQPGPGGKVRIVFRVKTNRGWSDEDNGFNGGSSLGKGAAIVDDVVANGWAASNGDFEAVGSIDNSVGADLAWRSTGKPVGEDYWELRDIGTLSYNDPCGTVGAPNRNCNMFGNVMNSVGGFYAANDMDRLKQLVSPTVNLVATGNGPGFYNDMGIDQEIADVSGDLLMFFDVYTNLLQFGTTGNGLRCGFQSYPSTQPNGVETWGVFRKTIFFSAYDGFLGCYGGVDFPGLMPAGADGAYLNGLLVSTNASGVPDSVRACIEQLSICFRRPAVNAATCNAQGLPDLQGCYIDNFTLAFVDAAAPPGISNSIWDVWQDAFPANSNLQVGTDAFRRGPISVRSGYNKSQGTGDLARNVIPGDTMLVISNGSPVRTDLVFRIKPGPGNYQTIGDPTSGIRRDPATAITATPGDGSFWGSYMADRGLYGSGFVLNSSTAVPSPMTDRFAGGGLDWDPDQWVSARMDTAENNLFNCDGSAGNVSQLRNAQYASQYHESELVPGAPRATLGVVKNRCVLIDVASGSSQSQDNIDCGTGTTPAHPSGVTWADRWNSLQPNNYVTAIGGYSDNTCNGPCAVGTTAEFTKIIPDNQLTPGAHVEWFFRRTFDGNFADFEMLPDTTLIFPNAGGIFDGTRWYSINALPDEWKNPSYNNFGYPASNGMACMLFVDQGDRRGDHLLWDNMAGVIGLTATWKRGASSGYYIPATADIPADLTELATVGGTAVSAHLGQEGSLYDAFNVRAGESNVPAGRLGSRDGAPCIGLATGKCSTAGPTKTWLRELYQHLFVSCTDQKQQVWGPLPDQTDGDIPMFTDFVDNPNGTPAPRTFIVAGLDIVAGNTTAASGHPSFFPTYFDAGFVDDSYRDLSASTDDSPDLIPQAPIGTGGAIYGVFSSCFTLNDVLSRLATITGSTTAALYEDTNPLDATTYPAAIYAPEDIPGNRFARTLVIGFTHGAFGGLGSRYTLGRGGYNTFWLDALTGMIGTVCGATLSAPVGVGDGGVSGKAFVNFMNLRSPNPMKSGTAVIEFGLAKNEKVQINVYDVTGRLVKTLADREFKAGDIHRLTWDGTNENGQSVARGVYFYQLRSPSFTSQKKLTVLRD